MKSAGYLAVSGGTMLFLGGSAGSLMFKTVRDFITPYLSGPAGENVALVLEILIILAALGGITVIAGGYFILRGLERVGKILIFIGLGTGLISLIIQLIVAFATGTFDLFKGSLATMTGIGTLLSIIASKLA